MAFLTYEENEYLVSLRRHFHMNPELSFREEQTSRLIEKELRELNLNPRRVGETGVTVDIVGSEGGRTVAVRADMDALPVSEENPVDYRSRIEGVMHACGHDAHMAMALSLIKLCLRNRSDLRGRVRFLFQPAEEQPPGGALTLIKEEALEGVHYILGQHVISTIPSGVIAIRPGPSMASMDKFTIKIHGPGGHGSAPHETVDVLLVAAELVLLAQSIVSRRVNPLRPVVLSFGTFKSGYTFNVIPAHAELTGTVRTLDQSTRKLIHDELETLLRNIAAVNRVEYEFLYEEGYPVLVNDAKVSRAVEEAAIETVGRKKTIQPDPLMGSEDYAYYLQNVPGAFYFLGVGNPSKNITKPNHSPKFDLDEDALKIGVEVMYRSIKKLLDKGAQQEPMAK